MPHYITVLRAPKYWMKSTAHTPYIMRLMIVDLCLPGHAFHFNSSVCKKK